MTRLPTFGVEDERYCQHPSTECCGVPPRRNPNPRDRKDRGRGQVDGLIWQDVERICLLAEMENILSGLRDAAMIRLMSDCLLRISEVAAVNIEDFTDKTLIVRTSKTDPEGTGEPLYVCEKTRQVLKRYREQAGIDSGAVFRRIRCGGYIQPSRLNPHSARRIIKKRASDAGMEVSSLVNPCVLALLSHSHRLEQPLSICKSQDTGNLPRCPYITQTPNLPSVEQLSTSKKANRNNPEKRKELRKEFMTAEHKLLFPFTTKEEIHDWAKCYIHAQTGAQRRVEQYLISLKNTVVQARGYLLYNEFYDFYYWKLKRQPPLIKEDSETCIEKVTRKAFSLNDDWEKIEKLTDIVGVGESVASVILHLYDEGDYPILDVHALWSLTINHNDVFYDEPFWKKYVKFCQAKAKCHGVCMRKLDRALYKFSESGAAFALKKITDDNALCQLAFL